MKANNALPPPHDYHDATFTGTVFSRNATGMRLDWLLEQLRRRRPPLSCWEDPVPTAGPPGGAVVGGVQGSGARVGLRSPPRAGGDVVLDYSGLPDEERVALVRFRRPAGPAWHVSAPVRGGEGSLRLNVPSALLGEELTVEVLALGSTPGRRLARTNRIHLKLR